MKRALWIAYGFPVRFEKVASIGYFWTGRVVRAI